MSGFVRRLRGLIAPRHPAAAQPLPSAASPSFAEHWHPDDVHAPPLDAGIDDPWALAPLPAPPGGRPADVAPIAPAGGTQAPPIVAAPAIAPPSPTAPVALRGNTAPPGAPPPARRLPETTLRLTWPGELPESSPSDYQPEPALSPDAAFPDASSPDALPPDALPPGAWRTVELPTAELPPSALRPAAGIDLDWDMPAIPDPSELPPGPPGQQDGALHEAEFLDGFDLPDYDPNLSQRLGFEETAEPLPAQERARARAAQIAALLDVTTRRDQNAARAWLEDFFERRPAAATFRAIERAAEEGLDLPTLQAMDELRDVWADHPEWWVGRIIRPRVSDSVTGTERLANGATALSWAMACRICRARADLPPEDMIDADWLNEWLALPREARGPISFAQYVDEKIAHAGAELLHAGFLARALHDDPTEYFDRLGWHRHITDADGVTPLSLRMVNLTERRVEKKDDGNE